MKFTLTEVLREADAFFMGRSSVHQAAEHIAAELTKLGLPFAIAGGLAVNVHGVRRMTEDVDVLLTPSALATFKAAWLGRGWVERFAGSRGIRDAVHDVKIDILLTGDYPGDGKPKPVAFPDPDAVAERDRDTGYPVLDLRTLIELKLASGMTAPHRLQDLTDVLRLIGANGLPRDYAERLDPYVRPKFAELWEAAQHADDDY